MEGGAKAENGKGGEGVQRGANRRETRRRVYFTENKMAQSEHFRLSKLAHVRYQGYLQETTVTAAAGSSRPKGQRKGK